MQQQLKLSEINNNQSIYNVGTAGHVMHGKSTFVAYVSGTKTQRHQAEQETNKTINLGYANFKLFVSRSGKLYHFPSITTHAHDPETDEPLSLLYHLSFVDCPGHRDYMATMVSGSNIMDSALVMVAANEQVPQPQTHNHIVALGYSNISNMLFLLNKLDLLKEREAYEVHARLRKYLDQQELGQYPIYPISAATGQNVAEVMRYIASKVQEKIPRIIAEINEPLSMYIVRSYNVNRPNVELENMVGAVIGGTIIKGAIAVGDQVEIRPGVIVTRNGKRCIQPLISRVTSLQSDKNKMQVAIPGGLIGVNLSLYAGLANKDRLKGQVVGHYGRMPDMYDAIYGSYNLLEEFQTLDLKSAFGLSVVVNGIMNVKVTAIATKSAKGEKKTKGDKGEDMSEMSTSSAKGKGKIQLQLESPVVLDIQKDTKVALMLNGALVASLKIKEGTLSLPIVYPEGLVTDAPVQTYEIINDLHDLPSLHNKETPSFESLLNEFQFRNKSVKGVKLSLPTLTSVNMATFVSKNDIEKLISELTQEGGALVPDKVSILDALLLNIAKEIPQTSPRVNNEGTLVLNGRVKSNAFGNFLHDFQAKLLTCPSCRCNRCTLSSNKLMYIRTCHSCPAKTYLPSLKMSELSH